MNSGIIANRYAKALLKYVKGMDEEELVYSQASTLAEIFLELPQFREALERSRELSLARRLELVDTALQGQMSQTLRSFMVLVDSHSRMEFFSRMMVSFVDQYREYKNIKMGSLSLAVPMRDVHGRLEDMIAEHTGGTVVLKEKIDESLIGGFILQVGDMRMDASVAGQFRKIRTVLTENDNRII